MVKDLPINNSLILAVLFFETQSQWSRLHMFTALSSVFLNSSSHLYPHSLLSPAELFSALCPTPHVKFQGTGVDLVGKFRGWLHETFPWLTMKEHEEILTGPVSLWDTAHSHEATSFENTIQQNFFFFFENCEPKVLKTRCFLVFFFQITGNRIIK